MKVREHSQKSVLSFYHINARDQIWTARFGNKWTISLTLHPVSNLKVLIIQKLTLHQKIHGGISRLFHIIAICCLPLPIGQILSFLVYCLLFTKIYAHDFTPLSHHKGNMVSMLCVILIFICNHEHLLEVTFKQVLGAFMLFSCLYDTWLLERCSLVFQAPARGHWVVSISFPFFFKLRILLS